MDKNKPIMDKTKKDTGVASRHGDPVDEAGQSGCQGARVPEGRARSEDYGMNYDPRNDKVVERARSVPDEKWSELPVESLPAGTSLEANEETLKKESIDKVISGAEPFREGYVTKLWRDKNYKLHVVDGHHRAAMYYALGKAMPVRIMDEAAYNRLVQAARTGTLK
jgi:hypothetical protein